MKLFEQVKTVIQSLTGERGEPAGKLHHRILRNKVALCALVGLVVMVLLIMTS